MLRRRPIPDPRHGELTGQPLPLELGDSVAFERRPAAQIFWEGLGRDARTHVPALAPIDEREELRPRGVESLAQDAGDAPSRKDLHTGAHPALVHTERGEANEEGPESRFRIFDRCSVTRTQGRDDVD